MGLGEDRGWSLTSFSLLDGGNQGLGDPDHPEEVDIHHPLELLNGGELNHAAKENATETRRW